MLNRNRRLTLVSLCFAVLAPLSSLDASPIRYKQKKWTHYGVRPLAMGNAYVAVADDFNALFYNPAGLARLKEWDGEFLNPTFEISSETLAFAQDLTELASGSASDTTAILDLIKKNSGKNHHLALGTTPHLIFPNFGFGIGFETEMSLTFSRDPSIYLNAGPSVIMPFSYALNFLEDRLSIGASLKLRYRLGIDHEFSITDLQVLQDSEDESKLDEFVQHGNGYGADLGMLFTPMKPMEPTIGLSITDVGGSSYTAMDISGQEAAAPERVLPSVNVGLSLKPIQSDRMYLLTAVDMHSINQPYDFSKKLNVGLELGLGEIFKIQSGLYQGYMSGGFELDVGLLALRFSTYAAELGTVAGKVQDRRYALQIKLLI